MAIFSIDSHRAFICHFSRIRVRLKPLATLFELHSFDSRIYNFGNHLMSILIIELIIVGLSIMWKNHIWLLRASCILNRISPSNPFPVLYNVVLCCSILHMNEPSGWRLNALIIVLRGFYAVRVFILEGLEEFMRCLLWATYFFHLLPDVFNVKVHHIFFWLQINASCAIESLSLYWTTFTLNQSRVATIQVWPLFYLLSIFECFAALHTTVCCISIFCNFCGWRLKIWWRCIVRQLNLRVWKLSTSRHIEITILLDRAWSLWWISNFRFFLLGFRNVFNWPWFFSVNIFGIFRSYERLLKRLLNWVSLSPQLINNHLLGFHLSRCFRMLFYLLYRHAKFHRSRWYCHARTSFSLWRLCRSRLEINVLCRYSGNSSLNNFVLLIIWRKRCFRVGNPLSITLSCCKLKVNRPSYLGLVLQCRNWWLLV